MPDGRPIRPRVLAVARRILEARLIGGTAGNVSARRPAADTFWITPSGVSFSALEAAQLVEVDLSGKRLRGRLKPSSDTMTHAAIYRRRPDVAGIVHTHSDYASVFAVLRRPIPPLLVDAAGYLGGDVPVMPYLQPARADAPQQVARSLGKDRCALLPNHGVIAVGESVESALTAAMLVEQSARVAYLASLLGKPHPLSRIDVTRMHRYLHLEYGQR